MTHWLHGMLIGHTLWIIQCADLLTLANARSYFLCNLYTITAELAILSYRI